jgi:hypothetical protein
MWLFGLIIQICQESEFEYVYVICIRLQEFLNLSQYPDVGVLLKSQGMLFIEPI